MSKEGLDTGRIPQSFRLDRGGIFRRVAAVQTHFRPPLVKDDLASMDAPSSRRIIAGAGDRGVHVGAAESLHADDFCRSRHRTSGGPPRNTAPVLRTMTL